METSHSSTEVEQFWDRMGDRLGTPGDAGIGLISMLLRGKWTVTNPGHPSCVHLRLSISKLYNQHQWGKACFLNLDLCQPFYLFAFLDSLISHAFNDKKQDRWMKSKPHFKTHYTHRRDIRINREVIIIWRSRTCYNHFLAVAFLKNRVL